MNNSYFLEIENGKIRLLKGSISDEDENIEIKHSFDISKTSIKRLPITGKTYSMLDSVFSRFKGI